MINIIIGGDVCPINRNEPYFRKGDAESIFNDLLPEFQSADLSIVNLECPMISEDTPISKEGPIHAVSSECIKGIVNSKIDVLCLANNHILDHGATGLLETLRVCSDAGVSTVGAGDTLKTAGRIILKEVKGLRIGIMGVAEHEFSIATEDSPGANPLDLIDFIRTMKSQSGKYDFLIVLVHAGASEYPLPSPRLRKICRFMAEMGANAVICQHSHCAGSIENFKGADIVYGQGNLIFDADPDPDSSWNKGFLIKLIIENSDTHTMEIIPFIQSGRMAGARKITQNELQLFQSDINKRSSMISDSSYIEREWRTYCRENRTNYFFKMLFGYLNNRLFRRIHMIIPFSKYLNSRKQLVLLENMIKCESHREVIETILEDERMSPKNR